MPVHELEYISQLLNSEFKLDDCPFDSEYEVDLAIDAYIDSFLND